MIEHYVPYFMLLTLANLFGLKAFAVTKCVVAAGIQPRLAVSGRKPKWFCIYKNMKCKELKCSEVRMIEQIMYLISAESWCEIQSYRALLRTSKQLDEVIGSMKRSWFL